MKHRIFFLVLSLGLCTTAFAQPRVGDKMSEFSTWGHRWSVVWRQSFEQHDLRPLFCRMELRDLYRGGSRL